LIANPGWTEYSLYFTFAEGAALFDTFHARGGFDSILRMTDSLWYPASDYRSPTLDRELDVDGGTSARRRRRRGAGHIWGTRSTPCATGCGSLLEVA
jgi:hypothetical protein